MMKKRSLTLIRGLSVAGVIALAVPVVAGCSGRTSTMRRLDAIDVTYRESASNTQEVTSFLEPLALLDMDKQETFITFQNSLHGCAASAEEAGASLEELAACDYSGELQSLGDYMMEYVTEYQSGLEELGEVYVYLESLMRAIEPLVQMREGLPELSGNESLKPYLQALQDMLAACESVETSLTGLQPPPVLVEYHALMKELFQAIRELLRAYVAVAAGSGNTQDMSGNPAVIQYLALKGRYQQLVPGLYQRLRISGLDAYMEKVELEINRLYLAGSR